MRIFILVISSILFISSCKKNSGLAVDEIPNGQQIGANLFNCTNVKVKTMWASDTLATNGTSQTLLGTTVDADYGTTTSSVVAAYEIDKTKTAQADLPKYSQVGDIRLYLKVESIYGNTYTNGDSMLVTVYKSNGEFATKTYNATSFTPYTTTPALVLYNGYIHFNLDKKVSYAGVDTTEALISIKLNSTVLNNYLQNNDVNSITNTNYDVASFYKNIVIVPTASAKNFITKVNMLNTFSSVVLRIDSGTTIKNNYIVIKPTASTVYAHNIINDKNISTSITQSVTNTDSSVAYMQGGVSRAKLFFSELNVLSDSGNVLINTAKLSITPSINTTYSPAATYNLGYLLPNGSVIALKDLLYESAAYFDGTYNITTNTINFNIARHVQEVVSKKLPNYPIVLVSSLQAISPNITKLTATNVKLNITYTKIK